MFSKFPDRPVGRNFVTIPPPPPPSPPSHGVAGKNLARPAGPDICYYPTITIPPSPTPFGGTGRVGRAGPTGGTGRFGAFT